MGLSAHAISFLVPLFLCWRNTHILFQVIRLLTSTYTIESAQISITPIYWYRNFETHKKVKNIQNATYTCAWKCVNKLVPRESGQESNTWLCDWLHHSSVAACLSPVFDCAWKRGAKIEEDWGKCSVLSWIDKVTLYVQAFIKRRGECQLRRHEERKMYQIQDRRRRLHSNSTTIQPTRSTRTSQSQVTQQLQLTREVSTESTQLATVVLIWWKKDYEEGRKAKYLHWKLSTLNFRNTQENGLSPTETKKVIFIKKNVMRQQSVDKTECLARTSVQFVTFVFLFARF